MLETQTLGGLASKGLVYMASVRPLASLRMGSATSEPVPLPRTGKVAEFKRLLQGALAIGYAGDGPSGEVFLQIVDRLNLRDTLTSKLEPRTGGYSGAAQAGRHTQFIVVPLS